MRRAALAVLVLVTVFAVATTCFAQTNEGAGGGRGGRGGGPGARGMDANDDGKISKDEWRGPEEAFKAADANGDGVIDSVEMASAREKMMERRRQRTEGGEGPENGNRARREQTPDMANRDRGGMDDETFRREIQRAGTFVTSYFRMIDANRDGSVSKQELDDFTAKIMVADADHNGSVSADEARAAFAAQVAKRVCERFMTRFDKDKDGKVALAEFGGTEESFKRLDANSDGSITAEDFTVLAEKWAKEAPERQLQAGPGGERNQFRRGRGPGTPEAPAFQPPAAVEPPRD